MPSLDPFDTNDWDTYQAQLRQGQPVPRSEQEAELLRLLAPRPTESLALSGIPNEVGLRGGGRISPAPPLDQIRPEQSYRMQQDPYDAAVAAQDREDEQNTIRGLGLALQGQDPFRVQSPVDRNSALSGWSDDPSKGGLGLAGGRGTAQGRGQAQSMSRRATGNSPEDILARELFGPDVELGFWDRARLRQNMANGGMMQMLGRREQVALQAQQLEEQKRQHDMGLLERAMASPRANAMLEQLAQSPGFSFAPQASLLSKGLKESDQGSLKAYQQFIPEEVQQRFMKGELPAHELSAWLDLAREDAKSNAKEQAKAAAYQRAVNKPVDQRTPYEAQLVLDREDQEQVKHADIELKTAQAAKARREAEMGPPDHSVLNRVHQSLSGGVPFEQGTKESQNAALKQYWEGNALGKTNVMLGTPAPVQQRNNVINRSEFLKTGSMVMPPAGASEGQIRSGDYIEITDKQKDAWGEVVNSGATLGVLFDMVEPLITAKSSAQAVKQWARLNLEAAAKKNPAAVTYLADSEAFSSRMARVFGSEVGVLTQPDVVRWQRALPTFGDTQDVLKQKKKVFMDIYNQSRSMAIKKIAGEDISKDQEKLRKGPLAEVDKLNPPSINDDLNTLFGGSK